MYMLCADVLVRIDAVPPICNIGLRGRPCGGKLAPAQNVRGGAAAQPAPRPYSESSSATADAGAWSCRPAPWPGARRLTRTVRWAVLAWLAMAAADAVGR